MARKKFKRAFSLQPDEDILDWNTLTDEDFAAASQQEKEDFIQDRKSVSYWKDAWRRLRKNTVAMVAMGVLIIIFLFAFLGPVLVPYGYAQFNAGAENLHPWHYTLADQQRLNAEMAERTGAATLTPEEAWGNAQATAGVMEEEP